MALLSNWVLGCNILYQKEKPSKWFLRCFVSTRAKIFDSSIPKQWQPPLSLSNKLLHLLILVILPHYLIIFEPVSIFIFILLPFLIRRKGGLIAVLCIHVPNRLPDVVYLHNLCRGVFVLCSEDNLLQFQVDYLYLISIHEHTGVFPSAYLNVLYGLSLTFFESVVLDLI